MAKLTPKAKMKTVSGAANAGIREEKETTAVHFSKAMLNLLRKLAFRRSQAHGGRSSVSRLVRELVETHREELEKELKSYNSK